ncbi:MAG: hypothetical protein AB7D02_03355, partial [Candidatus Paceibacterota bacterium]
NAKNASLDFVAGIPYFPLHHYYHLLYPYNFILIFNYFLVNSFIGSGFAFGLWIKPPQQNFKLNHC